MPKKIPKSEQRPRWIDENVPTELATSTLFRFNVRLQATEPDADDPNKKVQKVVEVEILPDLDLDYESLDEQMQDLPAQYAFWAAVYSEVRTAVAVAERKLKARRWEVTKLVQKEFQEAGLKQPAAETLKVIVEADERLNRAEMNFQLAQMQSGKLYHMVEALKLKAELARSLLGLKKKERENEQ